jgi:hypothetical protein
VERIQLAQYRDGGGSCECGDAPSGSSSTALVS